jgi:hypothetical protein
MGGWQKLEAVSKVIAAIFIPLAVAYLGNQVASANKQRDTETKFVELATAILSKEPAASQTAENQNLRKWAVEVINRFSGVPMSQETADALVQTTALPQVATQTLPAAVTDPSGTWGVVFGGDPTIDSANVEVTKTAERMGIGQGQVFRRAGSFRSVKVFVSRSEAEDALGKARAVRPSSYVVNMSTWCPTSEQKPGYFECTTS